MGAVLGGKFLSPSLPCASPPRAPLATTVLVCHGDAALPIPIGAVSCGHISRWWDAALPIPTGLVHVVTSVCGHICMCPHIGAASDVHSGHAWGIAHAQHVLRPWTRGSADVCVCACVRVCARVCMHAYVYIHFPHPHMHT